MYEDFCYWKIKFYCDLDNIFRKMSIWSQSKSTEWVCKLPIYKE